MTTEDKRCPYCGRKVTFVKTAAGPVMSGWSVRCFIHGELMWSAGTKSEVRKDWNRLTK